MVLLAVCVVGAMFGGCAKHGPPGADYVLVYLKTGPATPTGEERSAVFKGHMANIHTLADEKKLVVAGPFDHPHDQAWRGIFVLDTWSTKMAGEWAATDPGVKAGVFVTEMRPMRASPALRQTRELESEMPMTKTPKPGEPPPNIRGYVMVTAENAEGAERAIEKANLEDRVVWCGRFTDEAGGGVFVLDAKDAAEVEAALEKELKTGGVNADGWWSSACLMALPEDARILR
jgi:uncharacterized protein YciI